MDPKIIEDIRDRRTPTFDDPKGQMIYDLAKSLHEGKGVSQPLYDEAVKVLTERGDRRGDRAVRLLHDGVDDAEHVRVRAAGWRGVGSCVSSISLSPSYAGTSVSGVRGSLREL